MIEKKSLITLLIFLTLPTLFFLSSCSKSQKSTIDTQIKKINIDYEKSDFFSLPEQWSIEKQAKFIVSKMSDIEIVGQLFMFGYSGKVADASIINWVKEKKIGSVKIFGWNGTNLSQVCESVNRVQKAAQENRLKIPLFIATDQEGGWVRHIKAQTSQTPGNMAIGASAIGYDSYKSSFYIAKELRYLGINMNFAPTVDLFLDKDSKIIGSRSFSDNPIDTANLSVAFLQGHKKQRVVATAKHFPGHGNCKDDSHGKLPVIQSDLAFIYENDLIPYLFLIKEKVPAIMVGHINFPNITKNDEPATLSKILITDLLRNKLKYDGIVITDDLNMAGMRKKGVKTSDKSLEALKAGNDIVLISKKKSATNQYIQQWNSVMNEFQKDNEFKKQATASAIRILKIKLEYLKDDKRVPLYPDIEEIQNNIPLKEGDDFFFDQACRCITQLSNNKEFLNTESKVILAGYYSFFFLEGKKKFKNGLTYNILYNLNSKGVNRTKIELENLAKNSDGIIISVSDNRSLQLAKALKKSGNRVFAISTYMPKFATLLTEMNYSIATYGVSTYTSKAAFSAFCGEFTPSGKLPFSINEKEK